MMTDKPIQIRPVEIRCNVERNKLNVRFDNGEHFELSAELLRVESPSAEVQGHGPGQKNTPRNKQGVTITKIAAAVSYTHLRAHET